MVRIKLSELYELSAKHWEKQRDSDGDDYHLEIGQCPFCLDNVDSDAGHCRTCRIDKNICSDNTKTFLQLMFKLNKKKYNKELIMIAVEVLINIFKEKANIHKSIEIMKEVLKT